MTDPDPKSKSKRPEDLAGTTRADSSLAASGTGRNDFRVRLLRSEIGPTTDQSLWVVIRNRTVAISFNQYKTFIDGVMCCTTELPRKEDKTKEDQFELRLPFYRVNAYSLLKLATELFLMQECGLKLDSDLYVETEEESRLNRNAGEASFDTIGAELRDDYLEELEKDGGESVLPYFKLIRDRLSEIPLKPSKAAPQNCYGILRSRLMEPCLLELIWSYWNEEGMLVQTLNAISRRFQNLRGAGERDPLTNLEIDPLRPLNNLLWGYIQDEQHRLTVLRRTYEYDHHYGLRLLGRAVPELRPADSRSKFLQAFHDVLHVSKTFFEEADNTTIIPDGFPVLNALKSAHLILAEGAHNQFGDLPWTARIEMLIQQWLLARPEMREFLRGRIMVPYSEPWMDAVDTMKTLQGWTDTSVRDFGDLAKYGEQLLLSIRYGNWSKVNDSNAAANWALYWRQEIQSYIHAYRSVTGVDLNSEPVDATLPAILLRERLAGKRSATR